MQLFNGDCYEELKKIPDNSVDSLITDPPAGISFMGKHWDNDKGGAYEWVEYMKNIFNECYRVLKPGAHGLVWALPRISHRTATALETTGFEIRDCITHLFGTGWPKSLDISKVIDRMAGAEREVVGYKVEPNGRCMATEPQASTRVKKDENSEHRKYGEDKRSILENKLLTAPATEDAKKWEGWGTGLKPAAEFWWLVRKPISEKTITENVIKYGCGAINIDASRIGTTKNVPASVSRTCGTSLSGSVDGSLRKETGNETGHNPNIGRFPTNLVLSHNEDCTETACTKDCPIKMLDNQSGNLKSGTGAIKRQSAKGTQGNDYGKESRPIGTPNIEYGDMGGASRFFYCTKASSSEKGENNTHPTVKSLKLMKYLITLITPSKGLVLDPFMGSGSTGVAALENDFDFIGIEKEIEYFKIAERRIKNIKKVKTLF